jgi:hypothetical protein
MTRCHHGERTGVTTKEHFMMKTDTSLTRTDLSGTHYLKICDALGVNALSIPGLPGSVRAIERVVRAAIAAERNADPMPGGMAHQVNFEREVRMLLKPAFARLRGFDLDIERLSKDRDALAQILK